MSLTDWWPVRALLLAATVLAALLVLRLARRISSIVLATALLAGLVTANLVLAGNAYYGTYPTIGSVVDDTPRITSKPPARIPPTGQAVPVDIPGERSGFATRPGLVYLPRGWFADPRPTLPVVLLLHGTPGAPAEWLDPGTAGRIADAWADRHGGLAPILVLPDLTGTAGTGACVDGPGGAVETYLTGDVPAYVQHQFAARPPGPAWAVAGHSAGGSCALTLALRHPDLFPTFADFGGPALADPAALLRSHPLPGVAGWLEAGDTDPALGAATQLVPLATAVGVETCLVVRPGAAPGPATYSLAFADALPWLAARVGQVPATPEMTSLCRTSYP